MQQQRQPGQSIMRRSQLAQRHSSDIDQMLGVNTSSSRNHSKVIANALDALKSYNDRALLTAMMTKEHNRKASSSSPANVEGGGGGDISTHQVQSRVHAAMQAQLRQLEEYSAEQYERTSPSEGGGRGAHDMGRRHNNAPSPRPHVQDPVHVAMLAQMRRLDKSNYQRLAGLKKASGDGSPMSSQRNVAQLYNEINARQQRQHQVVEEQQHRYGMVPHPRSGEQEQRTMRGWRSVRRASAA